MQIIEDCALKLGTDEWGVFEAWAKSERIKMSVAEFRYEMYCNVGLAHSDVVNFALDVLTNRLEVT